MPFSASETAELKQHFESFDKDGNGHIESHELAAVMKSIGENPTEAQLKALIAEVDVDNNKTIEFNEFLIFVEKFRAGKTNSKGFGEVFVKNANVNVVTSGSAQHSFSDEEKQSFVEHINGVLGKDPDVKHLGIPIDPTNMDIFKAVGDGILLCKLINDAVPGTIDERAINKGAKLNAFKITENQNLVVNSAKAIGCQVVNIGASDLVEGKVHLVLGLLWQIIRIGLLSAINLKNHPYLIRLLEPGETIEDLLKLTPEQILLRWFNYHLREAGSSRRVSNFTGDIKDSECYTILLQQLDKKKCDKKALTEGDHLKRAELVLQNADKINCRKFLHPKDICNGNAKLNLAFVANLFNTHPGLEPVEEVQINFDEIDETREEKAFRHWMNSLGVDPYVNRLYDDLRDGHVILQLLDKIKPGIVDWSKVNTKKPLNKFKCVENDNYAIVLGKSLKFSLVGIGGVDLYDGNKKLTLAVVWQCMRLYILNFLKSMSQNGKEVTEEDIVRWCNEKVKSSGKARQIREFKDKDLSDSAYIFDLLAACRSESINMSLVIANPATEADKLKNAQYAISCARKMGATVFLLPEDIVEVQPKLMMTLFGGIMSVFSN